MPRQARIDIPGLMYHVMDRGIERGRIFYDTEDYDDFACRLRTWLQKSGGKCLAWCLMPNHFHFLVIRGPRPLSEMMHHVMTGYAVNFNGRHSRAGHVFQNRYKAIICDSEEYLLEIAPYIHLNPLRAHMVKDLAALAKYKWCGHAAIAAGVSDELVDSDELLTHFGGDEKTARERYLAVMAEKAKDNTRIDFTGGGLVRSLGGLRNTLMAFRAGEKVFSDTRILGESDFVESVLKAAGESGGAALKSRAELLSEVEKSSGMQRENILRKTRERGPALARAVYCYLCKERAGSSGAELALELGISQSGVSRLIDKGHKLIATGQIVI